MRIGVPRPSSPREQRVALTPAAVADLVTRGFTLTVAPGAGTLAGFPDAAYTAAGATVDETAWSADLVIAIEPPTPTDALQLREGATLISFIWPGRHPELVAALATQRATVLAMDRVPRTTLAQSADALSSMAALAGQRAVLEAAVTLQRPLGAVFSAAGKLAPAKVLIIGAGVAGLAAIGTAKALGAQVSAFDIRLAARDDVRSMGADFLELDFSESGEGEGGYAKPMSPEFIAAEQALFLAQAADVDVVVTTALVPGKRAPTLWTAAHVDAMRPGTVVIDLAAAQGGNCPLTVADTSIAHPVPGGAVTLLGPTDLAGRMAHTASELYAKNITNLINFITLPPPASAADSAPDPALDLRFDHDVGGPMLVLLAGEAPPPPAPAAGPPPAASPTPQPTAPPTAAAPATPSAAPPANPPSRSASPAAPRRGWLGPTIGIFLAMAWFALRYGPSTATPNPELAHFVDQLAVFVLACFVGWQVVWNVTPALHTPLMSVTNAISGIILIGGLLEGGHAGAFDTRALLGILAVFLATINIAGGFWVTHRMLKMFRRQS